MNRVYFACNRCRVCVDAGYRWCYWELEHPCIVEPGQRVDVARVLAHASYWNPPHDGESDWLYEKVFPPIREFFEKHGDHEIVYWGGGQELPDDFELSWLEVGYLSLPTVRYFVEVLKMQRWDQVLEWARQHSEEPGGFPWWDQASQNKFRLAFEHHLRNLQRTGD